MVAAALVALAWQSNTPTRLHFLVWSSGDVPLAARRPRRGRRSASLLAAALFWAERARLRAELRAAQASRGPDRIAGRAAPAAMRESDPAPPARRPACGTLGAGLTIVPGDAPAPPMGRLIMRYRQLRYRYTMLYAGRSPRPVGEIFWRSERMSAVLAEPHWRPDADVIETPEGITVMIDLAGVAEDDMEVQLYQDAVVVAGERRLPACGVGSVYHAAAIRQGPFRVEIPLSVDVDPERVQGRYENGLLAISLPKARRAGASS